MKRIVMFLACLCLVVTCLCLLPTEANAATVANGTCGVNLTWVLDDQGTLTISGTGDMTDYSSSTSAPWYTWRNEIKSLIIEDGVTDIGNYAFYSCTGLKSVTISESITSIGSSAFEGCTGLTSITIPDGVTSIGIYAFYGCSGLTAVTIGSGVTSIGYEVFGYCSSLSNIHFTEQTANISEDAFAGCSKLKFSRYENAKYLGTTENPYLMLFETMDAEMEAISIHPDTKTINAKAFYSHHDLTTVTLPAGVAYIGASAFDNCTGLTKVVVSDALVSIGNSAFYNCPALTEFLIPDSVTSIGSSAFSGCTGLKSITIPDSVTSIGSYAFSRCTGLKSITIPDSVTSIGKGAFSGCNSLESITVPFVGESKKTASDTYQYPFGYVFGETSYEGSVETEQTYYYYYVPASLKSVTVTGGEILYGAFDNCSMLTSITILDGVTGIGKEAFSGCTGLTSITIPDSVTSIGSDAFYGCTGLTSITIPDSVTSIGEDAFRGCTGLTSITIPDSVTSIGERAFAGCTGLTSVTIGSGVTSIGGWAFYNCTGLTEINIPDSVTSIGDYAFCDCTGLTTVNYNAINCTSMGNYSYPVFSSCTSLKTVNIGEKVETIPAYAFYNCSSLITATIGDSVTSIGRYAFEGCTIQELIIADGSKTVTSTMVVCESSLKKVTIPDSVTSIEYNAFSGCTGLTEITIPDSVTSIGSDAFYGCTGLTDVYITDPSAWCKITFGSSSANPMYYGDHLHIIDENGNEVTEVVLDGTVKTIPDYAFRGCTGLTEITIPDSVTSIGSSAFGGCTGLTSVTIGSGVTSIGSDAFYGCTRLTSVTIGNGVTSIGSSAFYGCTRLTSVTIGNGVTSIGSYAFQSCTGLTSITIPDGVTSIGRYAFDGCTGLTEITIPDSVTSIGSSAFYGCSSLESITIPFVGDSKKTASDTDQYPFGYIFGTSSYEGSVETEQTYYYSSRYTTSSTYYVPASLKSVTVTGGEILYGAFDNCSMLTSITLTDSVTSIGGYAFRGCTGLTSITIPDSVTSVGNSAFYGCTGLTSITIPDGVTSIGNSAFYGCTGLTSITIPDSVTSIGSYAFSGCSSLESITIPFVGESKKTASDTYQYPFGYIFGETSYEGSVGIKQSYYSYSTTSPRSSTYYVPASLKSVTVTGGEILYGAFDNCSMLASITIPDNVTSIGYKAFYGCTGLTSVTIPDSVTSIGEHAFYGCTGLTEITIPESVTSIGYAAFQGCTGLTEITIPDSVTSIGKYAFSGCTGLTSITIPDSVTSIGDDAFNSCTGLTRVTIGSGVISIGDYAFYGCTGLNGVYITDLSAWCEINFSNSSSNPLYYGKNLYVDGELLTTLVWPAEITAIKNYAFYNCTGLTNITIPDNVTSIGDYAFEDCTGLTSVTIGNGLTSIGNWAFVGCTNINVVFYQGTEAQRNQINIDNGGNNYLENATWHYEVEKRIFADQDCYYCAECDTYFLHNGKYALATVTFLDEDGSILSQQRLRYKQAVDVPNPTKPADNTYTYVFDSWDQEVVPCAGNATYTATYKSAYIDYTIKFADEDGTVISEKTYHWNDVVEVPADPTKAADNTYTYTFAGWDSEVVSCAGNAAYTATYNSHYIDYTVVFENEDGTALSSKTYHYGDKVTVPADPTKAADNTYTYTFAGWDQEVVPCAGNAVYTATYNSHYIDYTVKFVDEDGTVISEKTYHWDDAVEVPADPTKAADNTYTYTFAGWDKEVVPCAGDTVYTATYEKEYIIYEVSFVDGNGITIASGNYYWGEEINAPTTATKAADNTYTYTFAGWDKDVVDCAGNATYTATFEPVYIDYAVTFQYDDGTVIEEKTYHYGEQVVAPAAPAVPESLGENYEFKGWDKEVTDCQGSVTYTAVFGVAYVPGDLDGVEGVTDADAVYLLYHTFVPDLYPVDQDCDFNGDGEVNDGDAVHLLYYTFLPDLYPIS